MGRGGGVVRTAFLVDGFNLYHSLRDAQRDLGGASTRWLDLRAFCASFLPHLRPDFSLESVHYFSAIAKHLEARKPEVTVRHRRYLECLRATGVEVELGRFKEKRVKCPQCGTTFGRHEEKETDVAIGVRLLELAWGGSCDAAFLVTGDSDMVPALRTTRRMSPGTRLYCALPYRRSSFDLRNAVDTCFKIRKERYAEFQLPDPFSMPNGHQVHKPVHW